MKKSQLMVACLMSLLALSGCITAEKLVNFTDEELAQYRQYHRGEGLYNSEMKSRRQIAVNKHPEWKEEIKQAILEGTVLIGMTEEQVKVNWGKPDKINTTVSYLRKHEQWIYGYRKSYGDTSYWVPKEYLYFDNGILTSFQD